MSEVKVNKITPTADCGTVTLGDSGDTLSIPCGATLSNAGSITNSGTITNTGTISGGTITGTIDNQVNWDTTKRTAAFTAVAGNGYFVDTTSAAITVTLPASPSAGDLVGIKDYANTADTNNITIARNGSNIQGTAKDFVIDTEGRSILLIYVDGTQGWLSTGASQASDISEAPTFITATGGTITTCGNFKVHTFTGPGTFTVTQLGNGPTVPTGGPTNVDYLVVAGGGAGGGAYYSGGGGAGGYRTTFPSPSCNAGSFPIAQQGYPITIGAGGTAVATPDGSSQPDSTPGSDSIFSTITSAGGGAAGVFSPGGAGQPGGSGGGASAYSGTGGSGNTPPVSPPQGNNGGTGTVAPSGGGGGGGGGAGANGANGVSGNGGNGGTGSPSTINFSNVTRAGGGGGGSFQGPSSPAPQQGTGGTGGGGAAGPQNGTDGSANTGGGGGGVGGRSPGAPPYKAGDGGSGIVIIRYKFQ